MALKLIALEDDVDLRAIRHHESIVTKIAEAYDLQHEEVVGFVNKAVNRIRYVAMLHGGPCLMLPPVKEGENLRLFVQHMSQAWAMTTNKQTRDKITDLIAEAQARKEAAFRNAEATRLKTAAALRRVIAKGNACAKWRPGARKTK